MPLSISATTLEKFTTFGDLLRFLRRRAGLTQMELALAVGYSDAQISRLEQNLRLPDIPTIQARFISALDLEDEPQAVRRLLDLAANVRREDAPSLGLCPYKGLNYFDEADADLFAGREALTSRLVERLLSLASGASQGEVCLLAVVGASGSGKSSLVRAGLVPALRWNKASVDWNILVLTPTAHPLESLAVQLSEEDGPVAATARLIDDLAEDARSLHLAIRRQMASLNGSRFLLVVDQFEELFALCHAEDERIAFINNLLAAASDPDGSAIVVITLRADFYAQCAEYPNLREALARHQVYIGAMSDDELQRAIEEPARRGRWELEPGLVELLLHDAGHEPGALPLLSHALMETWQRRRGRNLTLSGYTSSGGVRGAIAETAEAVFTDQFTAQQKAIARRVFLRLTELGDETAGGDTRRRATFDELILKPEDAASTRYVLKALADARLVITTQDHVEVAHEALIREWPTLQGWLEENRESLRLHRHLTNAALEWAARDRETDGLYRGARLAQASEWATSHADELNTLEIEFLETSQSLANRETAEREAQQQRELEAAQKLARAERRHVTFLAGALIIAVLLALTAGFLGWEAHTSSQIAASRELAAASLANLNFDPERSVLLALQALSTRYTLEAENALHQSVVASRTRLTLPAFDPGSANMVSFSPDGRQLATASTDETVKVWDAASGELLYATAGHYAAYSPDGAKLATVESDGSVRLWDAATWKEIPVQAEISANVGVNFSPDGSRLVTIPSGNLPRIWEVKSGDELVSFSGHADYVSTALISPDGKHLLTGSDDGTARLWNAATGEQEQVLSDHPGWVWSTAYSKDGSLIATTSNNLAFLWDAASGERINTLSGHKNTIYSAAFSPDGRRLATAGLDRKIIVWEVSTGKELMELTGHSGAIFSVDFSPDGDHLASSSDDGSARVWDLTPSHEWLTIPNPVGSNSQIAFSLGGTRLIGMAQNSIKTWDAATGEELETTPKAKAATSALALSQDGQQIAAAGDDFHVFLWDNLTGVQLASWPAHTGRINALSFSPAGTILATASDDYKAKLWEISTATDPGTAPAAPSLTLDLPAEVKAIAFSPDGTQLATGTQHGTVKVWNLVNQKEAMTFTAGSEAIQSVAFSPDGKRLAAASSNGIAKVWNARTGDELLTLSGHTSEVTALAFSPDGKRIATASRDGGTKLWDARTGMELLTFLGDGAGMNSLAFSPDGTRLATGGDDGVRIYLLKPADLAALARQRVTRRLSTEECQKYLHRVSEACSPPISIPTATPLPATTNGRICQVTNTGGLNDNYFNASVYKGLQESARQFGWEATALQSASAKDYDKNMNALAASDCRLIVTLGNLAETVQLSAGANPDQMFMLLDFPLDQPLENVWMQTYAVDQAAFLAGYVAASATKTGKVGLFGGVDIPQVTDFMDGFSLGVAYYNEKNKTDVEVIGWDMRKHVGLFVGGFCCTTEGRKMVQQLLDEGADVILPVAGQSVGWGAGAAVQEHGNAWLIGVDNDWTVSSPEFADILLTSIEKRFDASVLQAAQSILEGTFTGGMHRGTLATGEVGISPFHELDELVAARVKADLEQIQADIIAGKIKTRP